MCRQIVVKLPNINFHENSLNDSRVFTHRQTDKHGEANSSNFTSFRCKLTLQGIHEKVVHLWHCIKLTSGSDY
jgi:hypothetical protein